MSNLDPVFSIYHDSAIYKPLIRDFTKNLPTRTQELGNAVHANDIDGVQFFAHRIKGAAASFGYPMLTSLASDIEERAKSISKGGSGDIADIQRLFAELEQFSLRILCAKLD